MSLRRKGRKEKIEMTEEAKGALYHEYCLAYCKALEDVLHGKALSEATQEERREGVDRGCGETESKSEIFGDEVREFILDQFIKEEEA